MDKNKGTQEFQAAIGKWTDAVADSARITDNLEASACFLDYFRIADHSGLISDAVDSI